MIADLRFAVRMLIKYPAFSIVAFLALVLGIGANTTVFGIVNTLLLKPLPVGNADQLVKVFTTDNHIKGNQSTSYLNFQDYQKQNTAFDSMAAYTFAGMGMTRGADTLNVAGLLVSGNYFDLLQVKPSLGRTFLAGGRLNPERSSGCRARVHVLEETWRRSGDGRQSDHFERALLHRHWCRAGELSPEST